LAVFGTSYEWNHIVFVFGDWFISLGIRSLRFIHAVAYVGTSFFFKAECYSIVCIRHVLSTHPSVGGHLGYFHLLAIINTAATTMDVLGTSTLQSSSGGSKVQVG